MKVYVSHRDFMYLLGGCTIKIEQSGEDKPKNKIKTIVHQDFKEKFIDVEDVSEWKRKEQWGGHNGDQHVWWECEVSKKEERKQEIFEYKNNEYSDGEKEEKILRLNSMIEKLKKI